MLKVDEFHSVFHRERIRPFVVEVYGNPKSADEQSNTRAL